MELFHATLNLAQYGPPAAAAAAVAAAATVAAATAAAVEAAVEAAAAAVAVETVTVTLIENMKDGGIIKPLHYLKRAAGL